MSRMRWPMMVAIVTIAVTALMLITGPSSPKVVNKDVVGMVVGGPPRPLAPGTPIISEPNPTGPSGNPLGRFRETSPRIAPLEVCLQTGVLNPTALTSSLFRNVLVPQESNPRLWRYSRSPAPTSQAWQPGQYRPGCCVLRQHIAHPRPYQLREGDRHI